jgi:hypothetical protein
MSEMNPPLHFAPRREKMLGYAKVGAPQSTLKKNHILDDPLFVFEFSIWFRPHPRAAGRMSAATATATAIATAMATATATATAMAVLASPPASATISCPSHRTWWSMWTLWRHLRSSYPSVCPGAVSWGWMRSTRPPTWRPGSPSSSWPRIGRSSYSTWRYGDGEAFLSNLEYGTQYIANLSLNMCGGGSVADPGCLSRIPDPNFYPTRVPDLGSRTQKQQQKRGVKKNLMLFLFL